MASALQSDLALLLRVAAGLTLVAVAIVRDFFKL